MRDRQAPRRAFERRNPEKEGKIRELGVEGIGATDCSVVDLAVNEDVLGWDPISDAEQEEVRDIVESNHEFNEDALDLLREHRQCADNYNGHSEEEAMTIESNWEKECLDTELLGIKLGIESGKDRKMLRIVHNIHGRPRRRPKASRWRDGEDSSSSEIF